MLGELFVDPAVSASKKMFLERPEAAKMQATLKAGDHVVIPKLDRAFRNALDYATTFRHHILAVYARIAEFVEADRPDEAIAALETAIERDPVNEELYQRVIRIHGRLGRPDAVRRTMRLLENRLAELGELEPSDATQRLFHRQLNPRPVLVKDRS